MTIQTTNDDVITTKSNSYNFGSTKEELLINNLKDLALEYLEIEKLKKEFVRLIFDNEKSLDFSLFFDDKHYSIKEAFVKKNVTPSNLRGLNVISVDGSSVIKHFMNVDFYFLKVICVKYYFFKNHHSKIEFYPDVNGFNNYLIQANHINSEENSVDANVSLNMKFMEINLLNKMIEANKEIDVIIIDGSIVLMPINLIFNKNREIVKRYDSLLREYRRLYYNCNKKGIILIGSIKDTRTSALCHSLKSTIQLLRPNYNFLKGFLEINYRQIMDYFSDIDLFNRLLKKYERSCVFNCKIEYEQLREDSIKKDIPNLFPFGFYAFYLKTVHHDVPCRIEFFSDENDTLEEISQQADLISSIILPISSYNEFYGLPIPQIEAHKRAVFKPQEISLLFNSLRRNLNKYGIRLQEKRRLRHPF